MSQQTIEDAYTAFAAQHRQDADGHPITDNGTRAGLSFGCFGLVKRRSGGYLLIHPYRTDGPTLELTGDESLDFAQKWANKYKFIPDKFGFGGAWHQSFADLD